VDGRPPAPPYDGEGPHALWHVSEDPTIDRFEPHVPETNPSAAPAVWAVDTRHLPLFWFPRDCPRGCAWTAERTTPRDRERFFGHTDATRIHVVERGWLDRIRTTTLHLYRLSENAFEQHPEVGGHWTADRAIEPVDRVEMRDLLGAHATDGIELRITTSIWPWWRAVASSTLDFSGSRLANAADHPGRFGA
jgi:hypothetical protein